MYKTLLGTQGFRKVSFPMLFFFVCGSSDDMFFLTCFNHLNLYICFRELISIFKDMMNKQ